MYVLSVSVNGETVRESVYASVIDATDDYSETVHTGAVDAVPAVVASDDTAASATATLIAGGSHSAEWDVPNVASDAGDGPTESDHYVVRVARISADDVAESDAVLISSRAVVLPDVPTLTADDFEMIASAVERAQSAA